MVSFSPNPLRATGLSRLHILLGLGWMATQVSAEGAIGLQPVRPSGNVSLPISHSISAMLFSEPA